MHAQPFLGPAGDNVVPFRHPYRPPPARVPSVFEAARRRVRADEQACIDDVADSAHDRAGSFVTLALFLLFSAFNAALLLAAFGARVW